MRREAQIKFKIKPDILKRLDHYVATEGSEGYIHASFEIEHDSNIDDPSLVVFTRIENEVYMIPRNKKTGLYDIPDYVIKYPGFSIFCKIYSGNTVKITEEVPIKVRGTGSIIKRVLKTTEEFSIETITALFQRMLELEEYTQKLEDRIKVLEDIADHIELPKESEDGGIDLPEGSFGIYIIDDADPTPPEEPEEPTPIEPDDDELVILVGPCGDMTLGDNTITHECKCCNDKDDKNSTDSEENNHEEENQETMGD